MLRAAELGLGGGGWERLLLLLLARRRCRPGSALARLGRPRGRMRKSSSWAGRGPKSPTPPTTMTTIWANCECNSRALLILKRPRGGADVFGERSNEQRPKLLPEAFQQPPAAPGSARETSSSARQIPSKEERLRQGAERLSLSLSLPRSSLEFRRKLPGGRFIWPIQAPLNLILRRHRARRATSRPARSSRSFSCSYLGLPRGPRETRGEFSRERP